MKNLKDLKLSALDNLEDNQDKKYDIKKERLEMADNIIKSGMVYKDINELIDTANHCKDFDEVWRVFTEGKYIDDFESYIGFGLEEIERIGRDKFLKAVDWSIENVHNLQWRKDLIKVVICNECKDEFTTLQLDYGICDSCKEKFDMERFYDSLNALEKASPGSSNNEVMMFAFFEDYRNCYRILNDEEQISTIVKANFVSPNAIFLILESIKANNEFVIGKVLSELTKFVEENPQGRGWHNKLKTLIEERKIEDIIRIFL